VPYLKHGNILAQVENDPATDFYTCKACHLDNGAGGHFEWQLLVDNPQVAAEFLARAEVDEDAAVAWLETELGADFAQYQYNTSVMEDVHRSHAMEFPYPQSMANCATCHEGKLDIILADENFVYQTCQSCHPITGGTDLPDGDGNFTVDTTGLALETLLPGFHTPDMVCSDCHQFSDFHNGYDPIIYADAQGTRYSDLISVSIDGASLAGNILTINFSATGTAGALDAVNIVPTVLVGLYGYDTKDYIVGPHERDAERNRLLEFPVDGETVNPRFTTVSAANGSWEVTADLSMWADMMADGTVRRAEIAVMPELQNADGEVIALVAPSRTFDLGANAFDDGFYGDIVKVEEGCNNCHDALSTTFHSPDRGGNIVVCRLCHITKSGGSHLEMQSRSIDSYAHSIHSMQYFDFGDIDFTDPVEALEYEHHINFPYPTHGITNCESCHVAGTFNVPDQSRSLSGILSASDPNDTIDRNIGTVPSYVTGPGSRACGACHRAEWINEDQAGELTSFNQHTKAFGYLLEDGEGVLDTVIEKIMSFFE